VIDKTSPNADHGEYCSFTLLFMPRKPKTRPGTDLVPAPGSSEAMEFRKTNEAIGLRVKEGRLSLLSRKLYNVMVYHAQMLKVPGQNSPISTEASKKYFWIPLADVARDAAYDSNDTELLKQHIEEFQNIKIHIEDDTQWTSERLVSSVKLVNPLGLRKKGGAVWLGFAFPPEVHELVMSPGTYTKLSIFYQGMLRSGPSLALYEICRRYATNPSKLTGIESYEYWYSALTGNPVREVPPPYKYFKRDVLKTAIAEINSMTDIQVELVEHKNGRRVEKMQFRVELSKQSPLAFPAPPVIDTEMMNRIMRFGFSQQEAADITAQYPDDKVRASIGLVDSRMASRNSPPLDSPAAYFRWSLKQGGVAAQLQLEKTTKQTAAQQKEGPTVMEQFLSARAGEALEVYKELTDLEREDVFGRFKSTVDTRVIKLNRGVENPMVRSMFGQWYAQEMWGEPTVEALATFVEQYKVASARQ
jgi:hypothetical protein